MRTNLVPQATQLRAMVVENAVYLPLPFKRRNPGAVTYPELKRAAVRRTR